MLSYKEILNMNTNNFNLFYENVETEEFLKPLMVKFPDYYNLRGRDFKKISNIEKEKFLKTLKIELELF